MTWDEFFMRQVYLVAEKSKDPSTKIGAVIVRENRVISQGYNGLPSGCRDDMEYRNDKPEKYFWYEHGERNAIYSCARHGVATKGTTLYTQGVPCADCARAVIQAGISKVIVHAEWMKPQEAGTFSARWAESIERSLRMFAEAGVKLHKYQNTLGVKGFVDRCVLEV